SGHPAFFLGTDSAPHPISRKLNTVGVPGIFNAPVAIESYAQVFEEENALDKLEAFASLNGPKHYRLPPNTDTIVLERTSWNAAATAGSQRARCASSTTAWTTSDLWCLIFRARKSPQPISVLTPRISSSTTWRG